VKRTFKPGEIVYHLRLGVGLVVEEWGSWVDVDDRGNRLVVNGAGVFEVQFQTGRLRSINAHWLQPRNNERAPSKPCMFGAVLNGVDR
jgi:hypothetical protein